MTMLAVDYSSERPDLAAIRAAGYVAVLRYLSHDARKDIDAAELAAIRAHGLAVGFVWETYATRPMSGSSGGAADGAEVGIRLDRLGVPRSVPVFYALDGDDRALGSWQAPLRTYLAAAARASGRSAMPYGSVRVVDACGGGWQTEAWSGSAISERAVLYQRIRPTLAIPAGCDEDVVIDPAVLWHPGPAGAAPVSLNTPPEDDMDAPTFKQYLHAALGGAGADPWHQLRQIAAEGVKDVIAAGLLASPDQVAAKVVAALPKGASGSLTEADVEAAVRAVFADAAGG